MFESLYRHDGWGIGIMHAGVAALLGAPPPIAWLPIDTRHAFAADPFLIEDGGRTYCFFESLPYATDRGVIAYADVTDVGPEPLPVHAAFSAPHHLSYPFLLKRDGEVLCIPEAGASGRISAYAARDFPGGWHEARVLIDDFAGVDPTLFEYDGRWWLFATDGRSGWNEDLYAWYADDVFGQWRPHEANPVKRSLSGSRPAGRPFAIDGRLYRPAQDCVGRYGARVIINEIVELSPRRFAERAVHALAPDPRGPYPDGLHTVNAAGSLIAVDGNRLHFEPRQALRAIERRVTRLRRGH